MDAIDGSGGAVFFARRCDGLVKMRIVRFDFA